jgi:predicted O-linked N-acetylglucosamine transferase (SPINDLY family)
MDDPFQSAMAAHKAGRLDEAIGLYAEAISRNPSSAHAHYLAGCACMDHGAVDQACDYLSKAAVMNGTNAVYREALGIAFDKKGDREAALRNLRMAVSLPKSRQESSIHLAGLLSREGRDQEAVAVLSAAVRRFKPSIKLLSELIDACSQAKNRAEAEKGLAFAKAHGLGNEAVFKLTCRLAGQFGGNEATLEKTTQWVREHPDDVEVLNVHSLALQALTRYEEALHFTLRIIEADPTHLEAIARAGYLCSRQSRWRESVRFYQNALRLKPDNIELQGGMSYSLYKTTTEGEPENILPAYLHGKRMLDAEPDNFRAHTGMASIMFSMHRLREGVAHFERAVELGQQKHSTVSSRLFHDNYAWFLSREEQFKLHLEWAKAIREKFGPPKTDFDNVRDPNRRLRIGFCSNDYAFHPVSYFFYPVFKALLKHHDVFLYSEHARASEDEMTQRYRDEATVFRNTDTCDDRTVAEMIRADKIDVLFDLAGHTSGNRLPSFSMRAAPVQVNWLGYPNTTGLDTMDYRLSDEIADPTGDADRFCSEKILRLPGGFHLYKPNYKVPVQVTASPVLHNGYITFGSFNNLKKVSPPTIEAWSRLMKQVPGSRIIVKDRALDVRSTPKGCFRSSPATALGRPESS